MCSISIIINKYNRTKRLLECFHKVTFEILYGLVLQKSVITFRCLIKFDNAVTHAFHEDVYAFLRTSRLYFAKYRKLILSSNSLSLIIRPFCVTSDSGGVCAIIIFRILYSTLLVQCLQLMICSYSSTLNKVL